MLRRVSNSEVATWLTCRRQYYYAFDLGIAKKPSKSKLHNPETKVTTLEVGTLGHDQLAIYYDLLKNGYSVADSMQEVRNNISKLMMKAISNTGSYSAELLTRLTQILERYWSFYGESDHRKYEVLDVEKEYDLPLTDEFSYVFRFDLLLKERNTGKIGLVDHKFKYDFFSDEAISLSGQMPKYIGALRYNDIFPGFVFLNQIRAKPPAQNWTTREFFKRSQVAPSNAKITNAMREQIIASQEITEWRDQPDEIKKATALRSMDSFPNPCGKCQFNLICRMEYDGGNVTNVIAADYGPNSYNYNRNEQL
jgi:PD-(D/E)XK nuclease superfamily protein